MQGELQAFEFLYLRVVGIKIAILDDIKAQIAEANANLYKKDKLAENNAEYARAQAQELAQAVGTAQARSGLRDKFKPSENLKSLYREAAKRFHPDLATNEKDRTRLTMLMADVNDAYKAGDEEKLRKILREWEDSPENIAGDDVGAMLIRTIRKIAQVQNRLSTILLDIHLLKTSDLFLFWDRVQEAEKENRNFFDEMGAELDLQISEQQNNLNTIRETLSNLQKRGQQNGR